MKKDFISYTDGIAYYTRYYKPEAFIDCVEGCLIDSLLIYGRQNLVILLETYVNPWASCFTRYIASSAKDKEILWEMWDKLVNQSG